MSPFPLSQTTALFLLLALGTVRSTFADPVVIAHPDSGVEQLTRDEVINIFLGRQKRLPSGIVAMPVEQAQPVEARARFYQLLVNKDLSEINAYWARLFFSGQARPPRQMNTAEEVLSMVAGHRGALGVVDKEQVDRRVRIVLEFGK